MSQIGGSGWRGASRSALGVLVALSVATFGLVSPGTVAACMCTAPRSQGDVIFTGTVTDSPNQSMFEGNAGVYAFDVQSVIRGDPMEGRVYTAFGFGGCGRVFELGATYRVHADVVDPDEKYLGRRPGVPLVTDTCMAGELLKPTDAGVVISALVFTPQAIGLGMVGLGLLAGIGTYAWRRRGHGGSVPS